MRGRGINKANRSMHGVQPCGFLSYSLPSSSCFLHPTLHFAVPFQVAKFSFVLIIFVFPFTVFITLLCFYHKDIDQMVTGKTECYLLCKSRRDLWQGCMVKICLGWHLWYKNNFYHSLSVSLKRHNSDSSFCTQMSFKNLHKAAKIRQMPTLNMFKRRLSKDS